MPPKLDPKVIQYADTARGEAGITSTGLVAPRDHEGAECWCLTSPEPSYECVRAGHVPCRWCNDEGVVTTHDGQIIGPCDCDG